MKKLSFKKLSRLQLIIITVIITLALVIVLPVGIYSIVNHESVIQAVKDVVTPDVDQIIGKWQDEEGITAYEFYEDQSYDYYISNYPITRNYHIKGNTLTLTDYQTNQYVEYKFSINGDSLKLTLLSSNGKENDNPETYIFKRVDSFNLKKPVDILRDFAQAAADGENSEDSDD